MGSDHLAVSSQVTEKTVESGDRRIDESGDLPAGIGKPQAWLTMG